MVEDIIDVDGSIYLSTAEMQYPKSITNPITEIP